MFLYIALLISVVSVHGMDKDESVFIWTAWVQHNEQFSKLKRPSQPPALPKVDTILGNLWKPGACLLPTDGTPINDKTPLVTITFETAKKKLVSKKCVYDGALIDSHGGVKKATAQKGFERGGQKRRRNVGKAGIGKFQQKKTKKQKQKNHNT